MRDGHELPIQANDTLALAKRAIQAGDAPSALREMSKLARIRPNDPAILVGLATAYRFCGQFAEAAAIYRRALALQPGRADASVYLGMI